MLSWMLEHTNHPSMEKEYNKRLSIVGWQRNWEQIQTLQPYPHYWLTRSILKPSLLWKDKIMLSLGKVYGLLVRGLLFFFCYWKKCWGQKKEDRIASIAHTIQTSDASKPPLYIVFSYVHEQRRMCQCCHKKRSVYGREGDRVPSRCEDCKIQSEYQYVSDIWIGEQPLEAYISTEEVKGIKVYRLFYILLLIFKRIPNTTRSW